MPEKKFIALSHSRLNDFQTCPLKFRYKYIDKLDIFKIDMDKAPHLVRGTNIHEALDKYITKRNAGEKKIRVSMPEVIRSIPFIDKLYNSYASVEPEAQIAIDVNWKPTGWFESTAYYRAIFDCICISEDKTSVLVVDWKTGKFRDYTSMDGHGQLALAAAIAMSIFPKCINVSTMYVYVDHKKTVHKSYTRDDLPELQAHYDSESARVNAEEDFDPKSNKFCMWCECTKDLCPYSKKMDLRNVE